MSRYFSQPKALYLLFFVQMWECFSYYGMRILLVLYMSQVMGFSDARAFGVYAIYCALVEFGGIFGGRLADRLLGQRACITLGGWMIASGHISMMLGESQSVLYLSLALIATGSGLFSSNVSSLLGLYYAENDERRDDGYTLFYIGINLGAVLASLCCGVVASLYGWHAGFGIAALGMMLGNFALLMFNRLLEDKGLAREKVPQKTNLWILFGISGVVAASVLALANDQWMMQLLPAGCAATVFYAVAAIVRSGEMEIRKLALLLSYLALLTVFYAAEEQIGSTLMLFSERQGSGTLLGVPVPPSVLMGANPFIIICFGVLVSQGARALKFASATRLCLGCFLSAAAFLWLAACAKADETPVYVILGSIVVISVGELLVGPTIYAFFSEAAPQKLQGVTMGLIPIGYSMASILSGYFSQTMAGELSESGAAALYTLGFQRIGCLLIAAGALIYGLNNMLNKRNKEIYGIR